MKLKHDNSDLFVCTRADRSGYILICKIILTEYPLSLRDYSARVILFIVLWIGCTMATTPPPIPMDNPLELEEEGKEKKD